MRHYEVVFLVHPNKSAKVPEMIKQYKSIIESSNGKVHRLENWGVRQLAYPINKSDEAHYVLMNIECTPEARKEITESFHFSDAVLRNLILSKEEPIVGLSPIMQAMEREKENEKARKLKQQREKDSSAKADELQTPVLESKEKDTEKISTVPEDSDVEAVKSDESDKQKPDDSTASIESNAQDTSEENKDADSTKK